jgi:hypothetical protein
MPNKWNERDLLRLTRDCELGAQGVLLHVVKADGPYMTARRHADGALLHTGRDYAFATKVGEGAIDDNDGFRLFSWVNDVLVECEGRLREAERRMRQVPTARHFADRLGETCARLEEIADEFADADHTGNQ